MFSCTRVCEEYISSQNGFSIRLTNSTQKRSKEPKKIPPSLYKEMQIFWAKLRVLASTQLGTHKNVVQGKLEYNYLIYIGFVFPIVLSTCEMLLNVNIKEFNMEPGLVRSKTPPNSLSLASLSCTIFHNIL